MIRNMFMKEATMSSEEIISELEKSFSKDDQYIFLKYINKNIGVFISAISIISAIVIFVARAISFLVVRAKYQFWDLEEGFLVEDNKAILKLGVYALYILLVMLINSIVKRYVYRLEIYNSEIWDFWTNVVDAFGMGLVKGFVSGVFADKIQYLVSLLPPLVFILEAIVGYGIWERMNYIDKAMNDLFDDDKSNDSVAVWEVIENSGLIFYEMWDFFGFIGKEFPNYDLSPATDAFSGTDYGESSGMVILPNGGNSPSGSNALSPSPNSDSGSNCVVVYFYVPFYGVKPTIRSAT